MIPHHKNTHYLPDNMSSESQQPPSEELLTTSSNQQSTLRTTRSASLLPETLERKALKLKGKERYEFLLQRKLQELEDRLAEKEELETRLIVLPCTRLHQDKRKGYEERIERIDEAIKYIRSDLSILERRKQQSQPTATTCDRPTVIRLEARPKHLAERT